MSEHVVAFDPGGRSGWASAIMSQDHFKLTGGGVLRMDLMADWFATQQSLFTWGAVDDSGLPMWPGRHYDVMVYESWRPRRDEQGKLDWLEGDDLVNVQHVGQLRWIARRSGTVIVEQHPSDKPQAIRTMPQRLKDVDRYSNEQHDQDARMHLWLYFWRQWFTAETDPDDCVIV